MGEVRSFIGPTSVAESEKILSPRGVGKVLPGSQLNAEWNRLLPEELCGAESLALLPTEIG